MSVAVVVEMMALPPGTTVTFSDDPWGDGGDTWDTPVLLRLNTGDIVVGAVNPSQGVVEIFDNPATAYKNEEHDEPRLGNIGWFVSLNHADKHA